MYYFALFAILLSIAANSSGQLHRGGPRSRLSVGRTAEICEPVYEQDRYRDYRESSDINDYRHRNHGKKVDNSYDYDQDLSEELQRELALGKAAATKLGGALKNRRPKVSVAIEEIGKPADGEIIVKKKGRTSDYNLNSNVNHLDIRKNRVVMKNVFEEGDNNDDEVDSDEDDDLNSVKPASRILEDEKKSGESIASLTQKLKKAGLKPSPRLKSSDDVVSSPDSEHDSPHHVDSDRSLDAKGDVNVNANVNKIAIEDTEETIDEDKVSSQVNTQNDELDSNVSEKNTSVQSDAEIISDDKDLEKIEDAAPTPGPEVSSTNESNEIVTSAMNSVTETPEVSASSDDADNKNKKTTKHRKIHAKGHAKKKKRRNRHKHRHPESQNSEQEKNPQEQPTEVSTESNVESTTSSIENIQESAQSSITENTIVEEIETEKKIDLDRSILKFLVVDNGDDSSSSKARKLTKLLDEMTEDEKKTILHDLQEESSKKTKKGQNDDAKIEGETEDREESKLIVALLGKTSIGAATNSDDEASNVATKNDSSTADETVDSDTKTSESETTDVETEKKEQEIQVNSSSSTDDEIEGKENGSNNAHVDEAETLDDAKSSTVVDRTNDDNDDKSEEKSSIATDVKLETKSHGKSPLRVVDVPEDTKTAKNTNVNSNVNHLSSDLQPSKTQPRRLKRIDPEISEKKDRLESHGVPKLIHDDESSNANSADSSLSSDKDDAIVKDNRRSVGKLPRHKNINVNKNINSNVIDVAESDEEVERKSPNKKSLRRQFPDGGTSNTNTNVNTNSLARDNNVNTNTNINRNVVNAPANRNGPGRRQFDNKVKLSKKSVDTEKEQDPDATKKRENRRKMLHKRHDDSAYLEHGI